MDSFVPTDLARHRSRFSPASIRGAGADPLSILDHEQCSTIRERRFGNWPASEHVRLLKREPRAAPHAPFHAGFPSLYGIWHATCFIHS